MDKANEAQRRARNTIQTGRVIDVDVSDAAAPRCRVAIGDPSIDDQGQESDWIPFEAARAGSMRSWSAPTIGEQVRVACPNGDLSQATVTGALYSEENPAPSASISEHVFQFGDGARITYDEEGHALTVALPEGGVIRMAAPATVEINTKTATVQASQSITFDAPQTTCKGALTVEGPLSFLSGATGEGGEGGASVIRIKGSAEFTGPVSAPDFDSGGVSLVNHPHDAQGEFARTSKPIPTGGGS
ncbi:MULTISPECIES: phage baseplate assembly protein V [unclassified Paraburkholderia]|uniref:phage baseplate assembly protein V n=1 Tax=unclassified Paraburkholderia TaxID=2615204 RepID=UPI00182D28AC|nr:MULTISPECIES: phage baseplate assembly protein V [unclassified Paraburkholderia]MBB5447083.1 phage baseplate assembly protein V [Paraburkholderia sp. WSM4177]MBB5487624.1 phage baseplate assembly protein V [Paraburkholderia sp. WSM4180]